jgi:transcription elongation factor SPT5
MMANLLDADFGSESEDDNFNPVAAADSDDDGLVNNSTNGSRRPKATGDSTKLNGQGRDKSSRQNGNGQHQELEEEDVDGGDDADDRTANDFDDDDDDDEDDDDEEDAVTVSTGHIYATQYSDQY